MAVNKTAPRRCEWCAEDTLYQAYHNTEWGVPNRDDQRLFEFLPLEGGAFLEQQKALIQEHRNKLAPVLSEEQPQELRNFMREQRHAHHHPGER